MVKVKNPILSGFYPDPSICRVGNDFYLVTSTFSYYPGIPIFHSKDLANWKQIGNVLTQKNQIDLVGAKISEGIFAPTIRYNDGIFYVITTNTTNGKNFYVTSKNPEGIWSDPVWLEDAKGIDPSLYFEGNECYYVGQRNKENSKYYGDCEIWLQKLDINQGKLVGDVTILWDVALKNAVWPEAPHIYKRGDWYYIIYSEGGTAFEHSICTARSKNITGPYEGCKMNPIFTHRHLGKSFPIQNAGHCDMVELENKDCYMVMLATRPINGNAELGRETFLAEVIWEDEWPVINAGIGHITDEVIVKNLSPNKDNIKEETSIISFYDNKELLTCRYPEKDFYKILSDNKIIMDIYPQTISDINNVPCYLGIRQKERNFVMSVDLKYIPQNKEEAGILYFYDEKNYLSFTLVEKENNLYAQVKLIIDGNLNIFSDSILEQKEDFYNLTLSGNNQIIECRIDDMLILDNISVGMLSSEQTKGFVGCTMGLYASGNGIETSNKVIFKTWDIKYKE